MNYRCHVCGDTFESHHTNYKHAKGFHPKDNPEQSAELAKEQDHCLNCRHLSTYDPVAARTRDLVAQSGVDNPALATMQQQIDSLKAQVEEAKRQKQVSNDMQTQIEDLHKTLGGLTGKSSQEYVTGHEARVQKAVEEARRAA